MSLAVAVPDLAGYDNPDDAAPALAGHGVPWSDEERTQLLLGLQNLGIDWSSINKQYVKSRTPEQIQSRYYSRSNLAIHHKEDMERALATYDSNKFGNNSSNSMLECYILCLTVLMESAEEDMLGVGPEADKAAAFMDEARDLLNEISAETSVLATQEPVNEI